MAGLVAGQVAGQEAGQEAGQVELCRVALLSVHTSPLDPPGHGDAGGMNVYLAELASHLAARGLVVDVYTQGPAAVTEARGYRVVSVPLGPAGRSAKEDLPGLLPAFAAGVLAAGMGPYDLVHSHYWLSGEVAAVLSAAWHCPVVHTMHTMAAVKNAVGRASGEPAVRLAGEARIAAAAHALIVNTVGEAADLREHYGAPSGRIHVVTPGVDLDGFAPAGIGLPGASQAAERAALGLATDTPVVLFVGRVQPHKGPDLLVQAWASLRSRRRAVPLLVVLGGPSGSGDPAWLDGVARDLGVADTVLLHGPVARRELARWYRAADLVAIPSRHESFGLVALEAQACGTPVVAAAVGGLTESVRDGESGVLISGRDPQVWADVIDGLLGDLARRRVLAAGARRHAADYSWPGAAERTQAVYRGVVAPPPPRERGVAAVLAMLAAAGVTHSVGVRPGEVVASLPGEHRLVTTVSLLVGAHSVAATAFVCRHPDSDAAGVHAWLLRRNSRLPGVGFAVDGLGDIYLLGRVPLVAVIGTGGDAVLDDLLGALVRTADESFDELLRLGFADAIVRERRWRESRGLPVANLAAFDRRTGHDPTGPDLAGLGHD